MIQFKPYLGLANRMRAINSAVTLARLNNLNINIIWVRDFKLNAKFSDLFLTPKDPLIQVTEPCFSIYNLPFTIRFPAYMYFVKKIFKVKYPNNIIINKLNKKVFDLSKYDTKKNIFIAAFHEFYPSDFDRKLFHPTPEIMREIDAITKSFNDFTYGIHLRRTDNPISIDKSPTVLFTNEIDAIISSNSKVKFYLATDSRLEKDFFIKKYKDKIITSFFNTSRQSIAGMKNAVVDLFVLSRTQMILGSYFSSFSDIAAALGQIPLKIIKK